MTSNGEDASTQNPICEISKITPGFQMSALVSGIDQTTKCAAHRVCLVPLWMLRVPREDRLGAPRPSPFRDRQQNQVLSEIVKGPRGENLRRIL